MIQTLTNGIITIKVKLIGAELISIVENTTGKEYLWQADPTYWKRHSPILFPIVGGLWDGKFFHNGKEYSMSQHGFARDNEFELIESTENEVRYRLVSSHETYQAYPFSFQLEVGYRLKGNRVEVFWVVKNTDKSEIYFQIGAHPAFYYPDFNANTEERGYFSFDKSENLEYILIEEKGCVSTSKVYPLHLTEDGLLPIKPNIFDKDALILENSQVKTVSLLDNNKKKTISLHFMAPVVGLWSPPHKNAPFVCIEPWYGRCDRVGYSGEFRDRDWMNRLDAGKTFEASYDIEVGE